jgi:hypothetical protein
MALVSVTGAWVVSDDKTPVVRWDPGGLRLELKPEKERIALYEPLVVVYTLRNVSDSQVSVPGDLNYGMGQMRLSIESEGGTQVQYIEGVLARTMMPPLPRMLGPHEADARSVMVFFNGTSNDLAFVRKGRYTLRGALYIGNDPDPVFIRTGGIGIEVREPSARDVKALEALGGVEPYTKMIRIGVGEYCIGDGDTGCLDRIRMLRTRFGDSAYAPAVTMRYGEALAKGKIKSDEDSAIDVFEDFIQRWPGHPLEANVVSDMVLELGKSGRRDDALEWLHRFEKDFPGRVSEAHDLRATVE